MIKNVQFCSRNRTDCVLCLLKTDKCIVQCGISLFSGTGLNFTQSSDSREEDACYWSIWQLSSNVMMKLS